MNLNALILFTYILSNVLIGKENLEEILQENPVLIKVIQEEYPKCSAEIFIDSSIEEILKVIEDVSNYRLFFDSIFISEINAEDEVHLAIDIPFPFSNRDYTVKFNRNENNYEVNYLYESIISNDFIVHNDYVRLTDAKGGWVISKIKDSKGFLVIYIWNGDMRGGFPNWAYRKAWIKQGNEIMLNLKSEVNRRNNNEN